MNHVMACIVPVAIVFIGIATAGQQSAPLGGSPNSEITSKSVEGLRSATGGYGEPVAQSAQFLQGGLNFDCNGFGGFPPVAQFTVAHPMFMCGNNQDWCAAQFPETQVWGTRPQCTTP